MMCQTKAVIWNPTNARSAWMNSHMETDFVDFHVHISFTLAVLMSGLEGKAARVPLAEQQYSRLETPDYLSSNCWCSKEDSNGVSC
mmetsp:Transcript_7979/g.15067  ORF Transcript_7979/g.15067 Transcript_7979/m.15067 type:complete len:86 (-) Transcript_7979:303-560(-)